MRPVPRSRARACGHRRARDGGRRATSPRTSACSFPWEHELHDSRPSSRARRRSTPGQGQTVTSRASRSARSARSRCRTATRGSRWRSTPTSCRPIYPTRTCCCARRPASTTCRSSSTRARPSRAPTTASSTTATSCRSGNTLPNVNPDEVLAALDATRAASSRRRRTRAASGLDGRGVDLRALLQARRADLRADRARDQGAGRPAREGARGWCTTCALLSAPATKDQRAGELVSARAPPCFRRSPRREAELGGSIAAAARALDADPRALADARLRERAEAGRSRALRPAVRELGAGAREGAAAADARPARRARRELRPLVREATPLRRRPAPGGRRPADRADADLIRRPRSCNYVVNELRLQPARRRGGLPLLDPPWFIHNANSILSVEDAHGSAWRGARSWSAARPRRRRPQGRRSRCASPRSGRRGGRVR